MSSTQSPKKAWHHRFLAVDIEATGGSHENDRITEIAVCIFEDGVLQKTMTTLVDPKQPIPWLIVSKIGITDAMVAGKPDFKRLAERLHKRLEGERIVAHNLSYDKRMLAASFERVGLRWPDTTDEICTQALARQSGLKQVGLSAVCTHFGIDIGSHHTAADDAIACGRVFVALQRTEQNALL